MARTYHIISADSHLDLSPSSGNIAYRRNGRTRRRKWFVSRVARTRS